MAQGSHVAETKRHPPIITLVLAAAVSPLAINIFVPSMPGMAEQFGVSYPVVQLGLSLYLAATAVIQLVIGPLSDLFGRRPVLIAGMLLFLAGTVLCLLAPSVEWFLAGRLIQATAASGMVLSRAIVRDLFARERAASMIGYVTMGMAIAPMIGPAIGGVLDEIYGWEAGFGLLFLLGAISLVAIVMTLPETNSNLGAPIADQLKSYGELLVSGTFWTFAATATFASAVFFAFLGGAPAMASSIFELSPAQYGLWFALTAGGYMTGNFISGRYSERVGVQRMIVLGATLSLFGPLLTAAAWLAGQFSPFALFAPMLLVGIGNGMTIPNATAGAVSVRPEAAGAASGLLGSIQIGAGAVASVIGGMVATGPAAIANYCILGVAIAAIGTLLAWLAGNRARHIS